MLKPADETGSQHAVAYDIATYGAGRRLHPNPERSLTTAPIKLTIDDCRAPQFCELLKSYDGHGFHYVVTPNTDHVIRYCEDADFRRYYAGASHILLDSQVLAHVLTVTRRMKFPVCTGSDLTAQLFSEILGPEDSVVLVGGTPEQARAIAERYGLRNLRHIDVPMGFIHDHAAVESCLRAIEDASPFRCCFLALGSPQQEAVAYELKMRGRVRGVALCVGASINFLTGQERRAPHWMRRIGAEWLFRLLLNPRRLARRYLVRGPRILLFLHRIELRLRTPHTLSANHSVPS